MIYMMNEDHYFVMEMKNLQFVVNMWYNNVLFCIALALSLVNGKVQASKDLVMFLYVNLNSWETEILTEKI